MASTYLSKTFSSDSTAGRRKWTWSAWVKRSALSTESWLFHAYQDGNNENSIFFDTSDRIAFSIYEGASNSNGRLTTTRKFRDTSAWYHIVVVWDSANSTAADRMIIYVNGERLTAFDTNTNGGSNHQTLINKSGVAHAIGRYGSGTYYFNGLMTHVHFTDGYAYNASTFGSTDATTGEWKINTSPSVTYGTNGFFILKDGNSVTDQSGNSNNWTVAGGTLTNLQDNPDNNFSALSNVIRTSGGAFSQVNNTFTDTSGSYQTGFSSIGMFSGQGKYYAEFKVVSGTSLLFGIADYKDGGLIDRIQQGQTRYLGEYANSYGYQRNGNFYYNGSSTSTNYDSFTTNDIIGMAVDMDNLKIYWHKNGTYQGSKNPASNNGETIVAPDGAYHMAISVASSVANVNFGNGIFGTTAISSAGTNASGHGVFEYDVPSGYTALSSKGLNV